MHVEIQVRLEYPAFVVDVAEIGGDDGAQGEPQIQFEFFVFEFLVGRPVQEKIQRRADFQRRVQIGQATPRLIVLAL